MMRDGVRVGRGALILLLLGACGSEEAKEPVNAAPDAGDGQDAGTDAGSDAGSDADQDAGPGESDAGSEEPPGFAACVDGVESRDSMTERLVFRAGDASMALVRFVDPDGFGTSGTTVWLPGLFAVSDEGGVACVGDADELAYEISRHNFDDVVTATAPDAVYTFTQQRVDYEYPTVWTLTKKRGDTVVYGPTDLTLESCTVLNDASDCTQRYGQ